MRGAHLGSFRWAVVPAGLLMFAGPVGATTTVFTDNFNRADAADLGANWTHIFTSGGGSLGIVGSKAANTAGVSNTMYVLSGLTADYTHTSLRADVSNPGGVGGQSVALNLGMNPGDTGAGLFMQVRAATASGLYDVIEMDTGQNQTDASKWTTPTSQFNVATPFASAWITAAPVDVDTIRIGIDTNKDGTPEETFTRDLNLSNIAFGNRMGLTLTGSTARADDFVATVIDPVNVTWTNGSGNGVWDSTSNNWTGGSLIANRFFNTDNAVFNNTAGGTVTVSGAGQGISPGSTTVSATSGTYTFAGSGIRTGTLSKTGTGRLVLTNPNLFTGSTTVGNAGTTVANGNGAHLSLNTTGANALSGDLHIGLASASGSNVAKVNLEQSNQIADNRVVYFDSSAGNWAYWSLRGNNETIAGVVSTNTGGVIENGNFNALIGSSGTLTLAPPTNISYSFGGIIRDADSNGGTGKLAVVVNGASSGTQEFTTGTYTYTGGTTVQSGRLIVNRLHENNPVTITGGTLKVADSSPTLPSFPSGSNPMVSRPGSMITIANNGAPLGTRVYNGTLDLGNNDLIIDYTGASPFASLSDMVRSGFHLGDWLGKGVTSSTAANPLSNGNYALGIAENGLLTNPFGGQDPNDPNSINPQFDNQTVDNTTVLIKFTHRVDLDLNGLVDGNDAAVFNGSFSEGDGGATWQTGDVDYDGAWTSNDAAIFNSFYDESLAHLPEPTGVTLLGLASMTSLWRRRRQPVSHPPV